LSKKQFVGKQFVGKQFVGKQFVGKQFVGKQFVRKFCSKIKMAKSKNVLHKSPTPHFIVCQKNCPHQLSD
jgi:hypothetical protein